MKKQLLTLTLAFCTFLGYSQITIDSADFGQIGDEVIVVFDSVVSGHTVAPPSSSAQTFDYTGLSFSATDTYYFLDPSGAPGASSFPNSNLLVTSGGGVDQNFLIKTDSNLLMDGVYGDPFGVGSVESLNFDPNVLLTPFPLNYGDSYTSTQRIDTTLEDTITGLFDSLRLVSTTTIISSVDAFGTLNLPNLSESVLRKYDVEVRSDSVFGLIFGIWTTVQEATITSHYYRFLAKNRGYYVLEAEADSLGNVLNVEYQVGSSLFGGIEYQDRVSCYGGSDGYAEVIAVGGTKPYTYAWSDGQTGSKAYGLPGGAISCIITDSANDTYTLSTSIVEPDSIQIDTIQTGADHGLADGFIDIEVQGGTPSFSYLWSNGETTKNVSDLTHGTYSVTVTDAKGCVGSNSFEVDNMTSVKSISNAKLISVYPNPAIDYLSIDHEGRWNAELLTIDGKKMKSFFGSNLEVKSLAGLEPGLYILVVTSDRDRYQTIIQIQ